MTPLPAASQAALVEQYRPLVRATSWRLFPRLGCEIEREELEAEGLLGLCRAAQKFDPERGTHFKIFAITSIRCAMFEFLRQQDWVPRSVRIAQRQMDASVTELERCLGRTPTLAEIAAELGMSEERFECFRAKCAWRWLGSLEEALIDDEHEEDGGVAVALCLADPRPGPEETVLAVQEIETFWDRVNRLPGPERRYLVLHFVERRSIPEIERALGLSRNGMAAVRRRAAARIREIMP